MEFWVFELVKNGSLPGDENENDFVKRPPTEWLNSEQILERADRQWFECIKWKCWNRKSCDAYTMAL